MQVTIVEDEIVIGFFLEQAVESIPNTKHEVLGIYDSHDSLYASLKEDELPHLIFIDISINGDKNGLESACEIKHKYPNIEIVFVTSFADSTHIQKAKNVAPLGYIVKPLKESDIETIMMVADSKLNINVNECLSSTSILPYEYDGISNEIRLSNELISLTNNELLCLEILMQKQDSYVKQEELIKAIWGDENRISSLREVIYRLRKKLHLLEIKNVSKVGYILHSKAKS